MLQTDSKTLTKPYQNTPRVERDEEGVWHIRGYAEAKDLLKEDLLQDGFAADDVRKSGLDPVLYQYGEAHRKQRAAIAKYFSPATVSQKHMPMMEKAVDEIVNELVKSKRMDLKVLSRRLAAVVTSAVVGLDPTAGMIRRVDDMLHASDKLPVNPILRFIEFIKGQSLRVRFWLFDVRPAIAKRKSNPQDDVISYMLSKGKNEIQILAECIVYGAAGMATTQEFICVVLMHAMDDPKIRALLTSEDVNVRYGALHEILRLDPVIAKIKRKAIEPVSVTSDGQTHLIPADAKMEFHVYHVNADEQSMGAEPERVNPHRDLEKGTYRSAISFGSGPHRCAGEHLAMAETDLFIRKLLAVDGLKVERQPDISFNDVVEGYEISNYIVAVE
ncbi:MAG: cytochrome P450 [Chloroflexota bacterium]